MALLLEDPIRINFTIVGARKWLLDSIPVEDRDNYQYIVVDRSEDLDQLYAYLHCFGRQSGLGWDTETTGDPNREKDGLHPHSNTSRLVLFQIGTEEHVYLVQPELLALYPHFKMLMEDELILHIAQNQVFDFKFLWAKHGIHVVNMFCTMLAEQVLTTGLRGIKADLKSLIRKYLGMTISKETREEFATFNGALTERILYYSARDVVVMFPIFRKQSEALRKAGVTHIAQIEFNCIPVTAEMELGGLNIVPEIVEHSVEYNQRQADRVSAEIHRIYNEALQATGRRRIGLFQDATQWVTVDLGSAKEKLEMFQSIGIPLQSTDSEILEQLDHPLGPLVAEWMGYQKNITTYGDRLLRMVHPDTGRFHPRFLQMGEGEATETDKSQNSNSEKGTTATGRYSSNAQQFPREKKIYTKVTEPVAVSLREQFQAALQQLAQAA